MGVASLILGIISLNVGFVPLCGIIAIIPAIIGLILGIIDVIRKNKTKKKKNQSIAGIIYCTYTYSENESKILKDDIVTIYGECKGEETYTTIFGQNITIPKVEIKYIQIEND